MLSLLLELSDSDISARKQPVAQKAHLARMMTDTASERWDCPHSRLYVANEEGLVVVYSALVLPGNQIRYRIGCLNRNSNNYRPSVQLSCDGVNLIVQFGLCHVDSYMQLVLKQLEMPRLTPWRPIWLLTWDSLMLSHNMFLFASLCLSPSSPPLSQSHSLVYINMLD